MDDDLLCARCGRSSTHYVRVGKVWICGRCNKRELDLAKRIIDKVLEKPKEK